MVRVALRCVLILSVLLSIGNQSHLIIPSIVNKLYLIIISVFSPIFEWHDGKWKVAFFSLSSLEIKDVEWRCHASFVATNLIVVNEST